MFNVLIYSKYSSKSKTLIDMLSDIPYETIGLSLLCIDNSDIRKKVLNSETLKITLTPCILTIHPDGGVEKYDSNNAFKWVEEITEKFKLLNQTQSNHQTQKVYKIENKEDDNEEEDEIIKIKKKKKPLKKKKKIVEYEDDDEVVEDKNDEEVIDNEKIDNIMSRPPISIRKDVGKIEFEELDVEPERDIKVVKEKKSNSNKVDIFAEAQRMQKDRDLDEKTNKR